MSGGVIPSLGAVVLAGGRSSRMGRPKAWLPFGDEVLLQRVVRRLVDVAAPLVVVCAPGQALPPLPPDVAIAEDPVEGRGPLQGIAVGLAALAGKADAAYVSSTDAPFVDPALVRFLWDLRGSAHDVAVPRAGGHYHPLAAVYGVSVKSEIDHLLAEDRLRPFFLFERVRTLVVPEDRLREAPGLSLSGDEILALRNLNTPDDWRAALDVAGLPRPSDPA
ncbi:molybdenum cofactor guanylyltransferase [Polyangium jinanense]|uniref:molybdenum cofactor guanylyltransferase n=1 Tax=Polyangium jinanense TaxID=2829994 RepID=UPI00234202E9|nr:molybdenum cofactor guanylyltransferase [Polyangium jinanense]MDC3953490.1 molybdenum cofactor guanylyltransferase [Polyangium jinanense]